MTCPHNNISLPTSADPDTVCADCGAVLDGDSASGLNDTGATEAAPRRIYNVAGSVPLSESEVAMVQAFVQSAKAAMTHAQDAAGATAVVQQLAGLERRPVLW